MLTMISLKNLIPGNTCETYETYEVEKTKSEN